MTPAAYPHAPEADRYTRHLLRAQSPMTSTTYDRLASLAADEWTGISRDWQYVTACTATTAMLRDQQVPPTRILDSGSSGRRRYTQQALHSLIDQLDPVELELKSRIRHNQLIVEHEADEHAVRKTLDQETPAQQTFTFPELLAEAAFSPGEYLISSSAQRLALILATPWIEGAGQRCCTKRSAAGRPGSDCGCTTGAVRSVRVTALTKPWHG
ncbi:MAG: hypothetical protein JWN00_2279 [Actinomycetia bacterium]|nr:hypothetical protein [Actinomycetes bacterium]